MYMALTGARAVGADAAWVGLATHCVTREALVSLADAMAEDGPAVLACAAQPAPPGGFAAIEAAVNRCFNEVSVAAVISKLEAEGTDWSRQTLDTLLAVSPSSVSWTFEIVRAGATRTLPECFAAELALTGPVTRHPDFVEGVRAMVVEKDRKPRWQPAPAGGCESTHHRGDVCRRMKSAGVTIPITVRDSRDADLDEIAAIYRHWVLHGLASFEFDPPDAQEMAHRRQALLDGGYPYLVAQDTATGTVLGYAYAGPYRTRPAYRFSVEDSVYVSPAGLRRSVASLLIDALIQACTDRGFRLMVAVIGDSANAASIRLHAKSGLSARRTSACDRLEARAMGGQRTNGPATRQRGLRSAVRMTPRRQRSELPHGACPGTTLQPAPRRRDG